MLHQQGVPLGFTNKDEVYYCTVKGRACPYASTYGQCSKTACSYLETLNYDLPNYDLPNYDLPNYDLPNYDLTNQDSLPDVLVINGITYRRDK